MRWQCDGGAGGKAPRDRVRPLDADVAPDRGPDRPVGGERHGGQNRSERKRRGRGKQVAVMANVASTSAVPRHVSARRSRLLRRCPLAVHGLRKLAVRITMLLHKSVEFDSRCVGRRRALAAAGHDVYGASSWRRCRAGGSSRWLHPAVGASFRRACDAICRSTSIGSPVRRSRSFARLLPGARGRPCTRRWRCSCPGISARA